MEKLVVLQQMFGAEDNVHQEGPKTEDVNDGFGHTFATRRFAGKKLSMIKTQLKNVVVREMVRKMHEDIFDITKRFPKSFMGVEEAPNSR